MKRSWALGTFCIVLTITLIIYNVQLQKRIVFKESQANLTSLLNSVEMDLNRAFFGLDQLFLGLENYLDSYATQGKVDIPETRRVINQLIAKNNYLTAITVLDANGQVLHWNNNFQKPNLGQRKYFSIHKSGQFPGLYIGLPQESILNKGQWIFGISKAIRHEDGSLDKVLSAIVDLKYFYREYRQLYSQPGVTLTITSPQGHIYTHIPGHDEYAGKMVTELSEPIPFNPETKEDYSRISLNGQSQLVVSRKLADYPFVVNIGKMEATVLEPWQKSAWSFTFLGGLTSLALLFMTFRTASYQKQQLKIKEELQIQAVTDPLTKLANRRYVLEQAQKEIKKAQRSDAPLSLIMLDLDSFKNINDDYGHHTGDEVLEQLAVLLKETCRESDIISRFGGEEFLLILPATDLEGAITNARKICAAVAQKVFTTTAGEIQLTASLGVTQWGRDETEISGGINRADKALYQVKKNGRNNVKWLPSNLRAEKRSDRIWFDQRLN